MMATKSTTKPSTDPIYDELVETYGKVYILKGEDSAGNPQTAYFKRMGKDVKRQVMSLVLNANGNKMVLLDAGIVILVGCHVGGYDFYSDEDVQIEAAMAVVEIYEQKDTFELIKKN